MPPTTNYGEIQHDEIEALRSIYMDDFIEVEAKTGAWNVGIALARDTLLKDPCDYGWFSSFLH